MSRPGLDEQFELLETRLQAVIMLCTRLRQENDVLHQQQATLVEERARLIDKNETARNKVEQMIVRLKSLEVSQ